MSAGAGRRMRQGRGAALGLAAAFGLAAEPAAATGFGANLIVNGDAEASAPIPGCTSAAPVPGWSSAALSVCPYGPGGFVLTTEPGPPERGLGFFNGASAAQAIATQQLAIGNLASD